VFAWGRRLLPHPLVILLPHAALVGAGCGLDAAPPTAALPHATTVDFGELVSAPDAVVEEALRVGVRMGVRVGSALRALHAGVPMRTPSSSRLPCALVVASNHSWLRIGPTSGGRGRVEPKRARTVGRAASTAALEGGERLAL